MDTNNLYVIELHFTYIISVHIHNDKNMLYANNFVWNKVLENRMTVPPNSVVKVKTIVLYRIYL